MDVLEFSIKFWNDVIGYVNNLLTTTPEEYMNGAFWGLVESIYSALQIVAIPIMVIMFIYGIISSVDRIEEIRRPEFILKVSIRLVLAHALVVYGLTIISWLFGTGVTILSVIQKASGAVLDSQGMKMSVPEEIHKIVDQKWLIDPRKYLDNIILFLAGLVVLFSGGFLIFAVIGRFFRIFMLICLSPISFAGMASRETQFMTGSFFKSILNLILQNSGIFLAIVIFSVFITNTDATMLFGTEVSLVSYSAQVAFQGLTMVGVIKGIDGLISKATGL